MAVTYTKQWDVLVIGSGVGGGSLCYELTRLGFDVLLVEKGRTDAVHQGMLSSSEDAESKLREGRWPKKITIEVDGRRMVTWPLIGCGLGGSTIHYGATLSRLRPEDFTSRSLPSGQQIEWPIAYGELEPFYRQAEQLFRVNGTVDPLERDATYDLFPPLPMSDADRKLFRSMEQAGLHPYRLHLGLRNSDQCDFCESQRCTMQCKSDVRNALIEPASRTGNLAILVETEVLRIETAGNSVTGVVVKNRSGEQQLNAKYVALAAGALRSPLILTKSVSDRYPRGIGNESDQVGRNLMFHAGDYLAIWPGGRYSREGIAKSLAFRDFYSHCGEKLGEVQSMGLTAGYNDILFFLQELISRSAFRKLPFAKHAARIPAYAASILFRDATVFSAMVEDFPYPENRVRAANNDLDGMCIEYHIHSELRNRVMQFRRLLKARLKKNRLLHLNPGIELNYGHPCGTCRAGSDPKTSVVDLFCRVHGTRNLYVVDASMMPTSGGTNPSLTVAANALRVAGEIARQLRISFGGRKGSASMDLLS